MSSVVAGKVIEKTKGCVYLDTKGTGVWDKIVVCDTSRNLHSARLNDRKICYYEIYKLLKAGDTVEFVVNLAPELMPNTRLVPCGNLCGEPTINGQKSLTILTELRAKETLQLLAKDTDYDMKKMLNYVQNFVYNNKQK